MPSSARRGPARPFVLALDGRSGAGKTELAARLSAELALRDRRCVVVHLDDLYPGWDGLALALPGLCSDVLRPLRAGSPGRYRSWDWHAGRPGPVRTVRPAPVVLVEGVGAGAVPCADLVDLRVWLEVEEEVRRRRALDRDGDVLAPHWQDWAAQEERLFARRGGRDRADVVLRDGGPVAVTTLAARVDREAGPAREGPGTPPGEDQPRSPGLS